jgi:mannose-6-phosphate isomerase-like protein (cupin superfamily)
MPEPIDFRHLLNGEIRSFRFEGYQHGGVDASFFIIHYLQPGTGPGLHSHPYPEIFITLEGEALMTYGDEQRMVSAGDIVIVSANTPHKFISQGDVPLKQVDIHVTDKMEQVELE